MTTGKASAVLHRRVSQKPITATQGEGAFLQTEKGGLLDLSSGAGITCLGYGNQDVTDAIIGQLNSLPYAHSMNFTTNPTETLARMLLDSAGHESFKDGAVMFLNGGGEAVEAACKLAVQYFAEHDNHKPQATFYAREHSYHGNSFFCLGLGDHPRKLPYQGFNPLLNKMFRLPAHRQYNKSSDLDLALLRDYLYINHQAIVVIEPIAGTTYGIEAPQNDYLPKLEIACHDSAAETILIYDEVLCGNFRTGKPFAYQHYAPHNPPDMIVIGKGLTGGYFPLSAVIVNSRVRNMIEKGSGKLWHSTTNMNHVLGCAAGVAAWTQYGKTATEIEGMGIYLREKLKSMWRHSNVIEGFSGVGTLFGLRLDPLNKDLHLRIREEAPEYGLALYTDGGTINGRGNMILIAPPYCITRDQLDSGLHMLETLLRAVK